MDIHSKKNQPLHSKDIDELLLNIQKNLFKSPKNNKIGIIAIVVLVLLAWLSSGFFIVEPPEQAVVKRFGKFHRIEGPGPHLAFPVPIESVIVENVRQVRRLEIGFRTIDPGPPARYRPVPKESLILTGDENILDVQFTVQYRIQELDNYLFQLTNPQQTVRATAEASMREIIGRTTVDDALTTGKAPIETAVKDLMQNLLNIYESGIRVDLVKLQDVHPPEEVKEAFKDVASAKEDREKLINQAHGFRNNLLPKSRGEAAENLNKAHAYAKQVVLEALGQARRFELIYDKYRQAKEITKDRIRIETMEKILPNAQKIIADPQLGKNFLPFLPIQQQLADQTKKTAQGE